MIDHISMSTLQISASLYDTSISCCSQCITLPAVLMQDVMNLCVGVLAAVLTTVLVVVNLLVGWICVMSLRESLDFVARGATIVATALPLRMSWIYSVVPLALTALWLVSLEVCARLLLELRGVREVGVLVGVVPVLQQDPEG